jgi:DNA-directed RNA polymerase specialized sigma subunit
MTGVVKHVVEKQALQHWRGGSVMSGFVSMDLYKRYKEDVWKLTNAKQRFEPGKPNRGLTDKEIAARLGLTVEEVVEIRCIAENDKISLEAHLDADGTKEKRFSRPPGKK